MSTSVNNEMWVKLSPSDGSYPREITERFQVGPSEAIHSDPRALDPLGQLADVDLILLGRVSLLRITPARKFRMLLHTNPTRERGECLGTRAGASEDM